MNTKGNKMTSYDANEQNPFAKQVRRQVSDLIDDLEILRGAGKNKNIAPASSEKQRLISIAQTKLEEACMFAVKAIYAE
ncbi:MULTISPECIES: Acb2/Tad1 domain-containing protein [Weeksellaceae]|uniref:Acb2/Tad1 hairpin domain-containing protein n=1 Tax=Riemerella anatipestifer TaxID=34085 RepID=A0AAP3EVI4_RIEAN|nr:hypothetical protein [Riemerella anatipestifer]AZZ57575.1 hypothetical protein AWB57_00130 [Riemerella anatipestifer]AZZ57747.1 hypothetical protein AWB57_01070 [Riemerella anatipestifer]MBT0573834.1 hypothetical protein [Riemerella anatipestifer]MCT6765644.1 hypothetical protein [Riemerella anatipestifer]MCT6769823.1 hypothetical protein [Riemerella anatipestifer]